MPTTAPARVRGLAPPKRVLALRRRANRECRIGLRARGRSRKKGRSEAPATLLVVDIGEWTPERARWERLTPEQRAFVSLALLLCLGVGACNDGIGAAPGSGKQDASANDQGEAADARRTRDGSTAHVEEGSIVDPHLCDGGKPPEVPIDGSVPPEECVAPCVWDLVKDCLPRTACQSEGDDRHVESFDVIGHIFTVYEHGKVCYEYGSRYSPVGWFANWKDGSGKIVTWEMSDSSGNDPRTHCGPYPPCLPGGTQPLDAAACADRTYLMNLTDPRCRPWLGLIGM